VESLEVAREDFKASATSSEAIRLTTGPRTPMVSQVSRALARRCRIRGDKQGRPIAPDEWSWWRNWRRQPHRSKGGRISRPHRDQEASFELSVPSRSRSTPSRSASALRELRSATTPSDGNRRIDGAQLALGGVGLGENVEGVGLVEQYLSLQVRRLNEIAVDDFDIADAGANEKIGAGGSDSATATIAIR